MSYSKLIVIVCDVTGCGKQYVCDYATTIHEGRKCAAEDGWTVRGGRQGRDICPQCNARLFGAEEASSEHNE